MKIGRKESDASSSSFRRFLNNRKLLIRAVFSLAGIGALAILFVGVAAYGAYVGKSGQYAYSKPVMLQISDLDFSFLAGYTKGRQPEFEEVELDIRSKHLDQLQALRDRVVQEGYISEDILREEVPAKMTHQGHTYDIRIALADAMAMHFEDPARWPLRVEARKNFTVDDMKRFTLLPPLTGGYMTDWLGNEILKERGVKNMKSKFVSLTINGKPVGLFYLQERFDNDLRESRRFGEGILFKIEEDMVVYRENRLMDDAGAKGNLLVLKRMWTDLKAGKLETAQFFDMEKMGKLFAIADLMNHKHPLLRENLSFYFNPATGKVEPIAREFTGLNNSDNKAFSSILEKPEPDNKWHFALAHDPIMHQILEDPEFIRAYLREAEVATKEEFIDGLLMRNGEKVNVLLKKVYKNWPGYDLPTASLYGVQRYLRFVLFPDEGEITAYFNGAEEGALDVSLLNQQQAPLEVAYLGWRDTLIFYPEAPILLEGRAEKAGAQPKAYRFQFPPGVAWSDSLLPELKVYFNLPGLTSGRRTALVSPWNYEGRRAHNGNPIVRDANHTSFPFVEEVPETNVISIPKGEWTLDRDLVIPVGRRFEVEAGARIDIVNHAKIICYSPVFFMGAEKDPIMVSSSDKTAEGLIIMRAGERSAVQHTTFEDISCPRENGWGVSGAVVFYESPVDINSVTFSNNHVGDDFLNIVRADFTIDKAVFKDINADAFDCDFCKGTVTNSTFVNVGNDGIDVSGTKIEVSHVSMDEVADKGLSAGEGSDMSARWVEVSGSEIAFTSKDRSRLYISDSKVTNSRIGITLFMKKSEYGPAYAKAENVEIVGAELPYLIEYNSSFMLDGEPFPPNHEDVKKILYGAEYGKASVR
ncbi:MAG: CotH kinase family protein [Lewinellaceae bacterium]|nr:CotH kinase family protein [Lewinellaceae bacterium]